ncbi:MAG: heat-inducible transcription repressor HrcA [Deltaproteobacteria bacterium]|nr:MAG: heat-inducible transcription repressor HrcA [Deltaproteobacteria bacterium]
MVTDFPERMKRVLEAVVEDYIHSAEPVGSKVVARKLNLNLSSATIRNIMSELEELGFLFQPHTSAGRVPTEKGFRFYVDYLLDVRELDEEERETIRSKYLRYQVEAEDLFRETSRILSLSTHHLGVVWAPKVSLVVLQHIEFVKLKKHWVMAILVSPTGLVYHRIVEVEEDFSQSELEHLSDHVNRFLAGLTLHQARERLVDQMKIEKSIYDRLFDQALRLVQTALSPSEEADVFIEGRTNIIHEPEFGKISIMTDLFRAFEEKATLVKLLDRCMNPNGIRISIGSESEVQEMETCSLVTSTYGYRGEVLGALGVIGPRRMNYSKVIPLVDYTARLLTEILEGS